MSKINFTHETISELLNTFFEQDFKKEFSQTLCADEKGDISLGGQPSIGNKSGVEMPPMVCEKGEPIGNIHSHTEPYFDRFPFEKGHSDEDIFLVTQKKLNNEIETPYIGCVISPTVDENDYVNGVNIDCEQIKDFFEEYLKKVPTGIVRHEDNKEKREYFGEQEIDYIRNYGPPVGGGMFKNLGFKIHMANLKGTMIEDEVLERDGFHIFFESSEEKGKTVVKYEEEDALLF